MTKKKKINKPDDNITNDSLCVHREKTVWEKKNNIIQRFFGKIPKVFMSLKSWKKEKKGVVGKIFEKIMAKTSQIWWKIEIYGFNKLSKPQLDIYKEIQVQTHNQIAEN